ncbi:hypothetical protein NQ315_009573 [Exocentrus adspersus]|uniref:Chitin-binding type-2 domain-containing protein n=1 Tax=Exocentrus adspersus TaxID=1586481 RepID=A0AAV8WHU8_9CUCU|nr:hypothetical protein NQ315_009573 [Exocentrus adspersus]
MLPALVFLFVVSFVGALPYNCPAEDSSVPVIMEHERFCNYYVECSNGQAYVFKCPEGLNFNPRIKACDWPERAGCKQG